jgi:hypothetical protein
MTAVGARASGRPDNRRGYGSAFAEHNGEGTSSHWRRPPTWAKIPET